MALTLSQIHTVKQVPLIRGGLELWLAGDTLLLYTKTRGRDPISISIRQPISDSLLDLRETLIDIGFNREEAFFIMSQFFGFWRKEIKHSCSLDYNLGRSIEGASPNEIPQINGEENEYERGTTN
jgi:hypothetical protein